jgi:hypothetical protein
MVEFEQEFNYDDVFYRDVTIALTKEIHRKIKWINVFENGTRKEVSIPFGYSFVGDDRFLLDAFVDDITGTRPDMNIDPFPKGTITLSNCTRKTSEMANPNVRLETYREVDGQLQKVSGYYRVIPVKFTFDIAITLGSEGDMWKCSEALLKFFHVYKYFKFEHKYMRMNAVVVFPDMHNTEIPREISGISTDDIKMIKFSLEVNTHYYIEPEESEVIATNKKVVFKGRTWQMKMQKRVRKWMGMGANE